MGAERKPKLFALIRNKIRNRSCIFETLLAHPKRGLEEYNRKNIKISYKGMVLLALENMEQKGLVTINVENDKSKTRRMMIRLKESKGKSKKQRQKIPRNPKKKLK